MPTNPQSIQLSWLDPSTQELRQPLLTPPITFGRRLEQMPATIQGKRVSRMVLDQNEVSRYHVLIDWEQDQLILRDQNTSNGTRVNGIQQQHFVLKEGDRIQIGAVPIQVLQGPKQPDPNSESSQPRTEYEITPISPESASPATSYQLNPIVPDEGTGQPASNQPAPNQPPFVGANQEPATSAQPPQPNLAPQSRSSFPPASFQEAQVVSVQMLEQEGDFQRGRDEVAYAALGAGLGSYIWTNYLRICGVKTHQIIALGTQEKPYAKYKQLCLNSQIPLHERLRSNSDSCPDNIWGWPSYAIREAWRAFQQGNTSQACKLMWQVFAEPTLAETYTPRADNVFDSIDREAARIGWPEIYRYGSIRCIRKTDDGRYAIAYSKGSGQYGYIVANYIHLATGYPSIRFLKHLQEYRDREQDAKSVVNAYEDHNHVYEYLERHGGQVIIQGRGIVASRILQRLYEVRTASRQNIEVIHLMRSPKQPNEGNRFGRARRAVKNNWEFQPFNWPKACWGGDLRDFLEKADPTERQRLMKAWGGTTTADRRDWQQLTTAGLQEKWYRIVFGTVQSVAQQDGRLQVTYSETGHNGRQAIQSANFIVDATGLTASVTESPLLKDLIERYRLPLINNSSLQVSNEFEVTTLSSTDQYNSQRPGGRMYAAGVITLGGPYAAVDSFLGLQYSALRSVTHLARSKAEGLKPLSAARSFSQWLRWVKNQAP